MQYFKIFCCIAYAHKPDVGRRKFNDKRTQSIFVGYDLRNKAYKLYDLINKKIKNVHLDEEAPWDWHNQGEPRNMVPLIETHEDKKEQVKKDEWERLSSNLEDMETPSRNSTILFFSTVEKPFV